MKDPKGIRRPSRKKKRRRNPFAWLILIVVVVIFSLLQVHIRMASVKSLYRINRASALYSKLQEENRRLQLEVAMLKSPKRIQHIAAQRLGMVPLNIDQVVVLK